MNATKNYKNHRRAVLLSMALVFGGLTQGFAYQNNSAPSKKQLQAAQQSKEQLQQLVAPIALDPDALFEQTRANSQDVQNPGPNGGPTRSDLPTLAGLTGALERLAARVAPAVVQVQVSAWSPSDSAKSENTAILTPHQFVGSGVIVDPSGYIITNEHVVRNSRRIRVMLTPQSHDSRAELVPLGKRRVLDAVVAGVNRETDLALLKVEASGLPTIPIHHNSRPRQGQLVLAVGSPEGLDNTMTLGIVSAVGRQPHPDFPMVYIQTDAAINPGNSGGPLLDIEGELIGINTFILSESGGSQGLGFAVPAVVAGYVYEQLRTYGAVRRSLVDVHLQTVTPALAQGLDLSQEYGVVISDVQPGSAAEAAGLQPRDIITAIDGASISALPYFAAMMYLHDPAVPIAVTALRGHETLQFRVPAIPADDQDNMEVSFDPLQSLIPEFGIFGKAVDFALASRIGLRSSTGIYIVATTAGHEDSGTGLETGDVIASLNGMPVLSVQELRRALGELRGSKPAVVQIERRGQFLFVVLELE